MTLATQAQKIVAAAIEKEIADAEIADADYTPQDRYEDTMQNALVHGLRSLLFVEEPADPQGPVDDVVTRAIQEMAPWILHNKWKCTFRRTQIKELFNEIAPKKGAKPVTPKTYTPKLNVPIASDTYNGAIKLRLTQTADNRGIVRTNPFRWIRLPPYYTSICILIYF